MDLSPEALARAVAAAAQQRPSLPPAAPPPREAAVAICLAPGERAARVLLMRRAVAPADPWSGQVSLPGGRRELGDEDLIATAVRETREEVGVDPTERGRLVGPLETVDAVARGRRMGIAITPFVFALEHAPPTVLGPEAVASFWLPLDAAASGALDDRHVYEGPGGRLLLPCWRYEEHVVWGLTHRILGALLGAAR